MRRRAASMSAPSRSNPAPTPAAGAASIPVAASIARVVSEYDAVSSVPTPLLAVTVKVLAPGVVGVPETTPVAEFSTSPPGSAPAVMVKVAAGRARAVKVKEYGVPA